MDKQKFAEEVLLAEETMYRVAKTILIRDCDCEDAVQDAVLKAYTKLDTLRDERYFKTWLIRILINECYRKQKAIKRIVPLDEHIAVYTSETDDYSYLYQAVMKLRTPVRVVIVLHYIEGYSVEEVGKILKIPQGTVKSRLHTGRKSLREELNNEEL